MLRRFSKSHWIVGAVLLCWIAAVYWYVEKESVKTSPDVTLWSERNYYLPQEFLEVGRLTDGLCDVRFEEFSVDGLPFDEALERFAAAWSDNFSGEPISFEFDDKLDRSGKITMSVEDVAAYSALWTLVYQNDCRTRVRPGFVIFVEPSSASLREEVGWFDPHPLLVELMGIRGEGIVDVRTQLESEGVELRESDVAEYNFETDLLKVQTSRIQLEYLESSLDSFHIHLEPTWRDRIWERWYRLKHGSPAVSVSPPAPLDPSESPVGTTSPHAAPDPFQ